MCEPFDPALGKKFYLRSAIAALRLFGQNQELLRKQ